MREARMIAFSSCATCKERLSTSSASAMRLRLVLCVVLYELSWLLSAMIAANIALAASSTTITNVPASLALIVNRIFVSILLVRPGQIPICPESIQSRPERGVWSSPPGNVRWRIRCFVLGGAAPELLIELVGAFAQIGRPLDIGHELVQHGAGRAGRVDRGARERRNLGRGVLAAFGKLAHFGRHHRKAAAMLAGPRRFPGGVERQ